MVLSVFYHGVVDPEQVFVLVHFGLQIGHKRLAQFEGLEQVSFGHVQREVVNVELTKHNPHVLFTFLNLVFGGGVFKDLASSLLGSLLLRY